MPAFRADLLWDSVVPAGTGAGGCASPLSFALRAGRGRRFLKTARILKRTANKPSAGVLLAGLVLAATAPATAQEYTLTTLAGPPESGLGAIDGPGSAARFNYPSGVAADSVG